MNRSALSALLAAALFADLVTGSAFAQAPSDPPPAPSTPPAEPTLDDLLGLSKPKSPDAPTPPKADPGANPAQPDASKPDVPRLDADKAALDKLLSAEEVAEEFEQAVALMGQASDRLGLSRDPGLETQRVQEQILRKLDKLLDDAQKRQNKKNQSSSSSKQQQQQQQQQQSQGRQQRSASQQQQGQSNPQAQGGNVPRRDGEGAAVRAGGGASWGNLPERFRDALLQGSGENFSSTYRSKTSEYYKRLAEEPKPAGAPR